MQAGEGSWSSTEAASPTLDGQLFHPKTAAADGTCLPPGPQGSLPLLSVAGAGLSLGVEVTASLAEGEPRRTAPL